MDDYTQDAYFEALIKEGLDPAVIDWIQEMANCFVWSCNLKRILLLS